MICLDVYSPCSPSLGKSKRVSEKPGMLSEVMYVPLRIRRTLMFLLESHFCAEHVS